MRLILVFFLAALASCGTEGGAAEPLRVTVTSLPTAYLGERYVAHVSASGGIRPYFYKIKGDLPEGIAFANGNFTGIPRKKGKFKFSLIVNDAALSNRSVNYTLEVADPPPPVLNVKQPSSETDAPFIAVFKLSNRPTTAFRLHLNLKNLKPNLENLKFSPDLLYVLRYDPKKQTLDVDGAFTSVVKGVEVLRLELSPTKKLRPRLKPQVQFFNIKGEPYTPKAPKRPADEGRYAFDDLRAIAATWPQPQRKTKNADSDAPKPKLNKEDAATDAKSKAATNGDTSPTPNQAKTPAPKANEAAPPKTPPEGKQLTNSGKESQDEVKPKAKDLKQTPALPGDLDHNGKVDQADLKLLRSSYAFNPGGKLTPDKPKPGEEKEQKKSEGQQPDNEKSQTESKNTPPPADNSSPAGSSSNEEMP